MTFLEITNDNGISKHCGASDNYATYILKSTYAHDLYTAYVEKYNRLPGARWYNRHFSFERINTSK